MRASDVNEHHDVNSQKGSMLFSKLPPELRLLIYRYSLCGYSEAVDSLYHNTFDFRDPKQFFKLPLLILPQRFHAIQSLQFDYCMGDGFDGQWDWPFNLWDLVASMKGLEQLRVRYLVGKDHQSYWFRFQDHYLQPLIEAEIAADVEIILPFAACERARIGKSNFRITIPEMDGYRMVEAERDV
ncbi:hypothetical protein BU16DRAFT_554137 [Lophium mytilinum]|uniref:DUF7730 domain-containing protein n=1 Tax=Lophium mytilinum TaxID=390894 RepID=A0A6A6RCG1_9PEZI|nr:hypothetical protein BU16DRAFT_554137 [Lophium mytilinum]